uniref:Uncharacterized protein n=1 Tax=Phakopsora pachyrhizi TaxID=170000 RepID=A0A0S1MIH7_PHAPC
MSRMGGSRKPMFVEPLFQIRITPRFNSTVVASSNRVNQPLAWLARGNRDRVLANV